jgi:hypothetical protein
MILHHEIVDFAGLRIKRRGILLGIRLPDPRQHKQEKEKGGWPGKNIFHSIKIGSPVKGGYTYFNLLFVLFICDRLGVAGFYQI